MSNSRLRTHEYGYLPFGKAYAPGTDVSVDQRYTYTGRETNPTSELMYYRYRQYDPRVGRFGARDPKATDELPHEDIYTYVSSNPIVRTDALGLEENDVYIPKGGRYFGIPLGRWKCGSCTHDSHPMATNFFCYATCTKYHFFPLVKVRVLMECSCCCGCTHNGSCEGLAPKCDPRGGLCHWKDMPSDIERILRGAYGTVSTGFTASKL